MTTVHHSNAWLNGGRVGWIDLLIRPRFPFARAPAWNGFLLEALVCLSMGAVAYHYLAHSENLARGAWDADALRIAATVPSFLLLMRPQNAVQKLLAGRFPTRITLCLFLFAICEAAVLWTAFYGFPILLARSLAYGQALSASDYVNDGGFVFVLFVAWVATFLGARRDLRALTVRNTCQTDTSNLPPV